MLTKSDLQNIKQVVKQVVKEVAVTKDEAKNFATKDDLKNFATKDDLKNFATKDDLKNFATKDDLKGLAKQKDLEIVKHDLKSVKTNLEDLTDFVERSIPPLLEWTNNIHNSILKEELPQRVKKLEHALKTS